MMTLSQAVVDPECSEEVTMGEGDERCVSDPGHEGVVRALQRAAAGSFEDAVRRPKQRGFGKWKAPSSAAAASPAAAGRNHPITYHSEAHAL